MSMPNGTKHFHEVTTASVLSDTATATEFPQSPIGSYISPAEFPRTISETLPARARTLVLCFDGTGDQFDSDNSNIVEFFTMLKKDDRNQQMVYYQAGIGTYTSPQVATPLAAKVSKKLDEMVALNLHSHVMDGYEFLMQNYQAGDRICIFGFSRGAYTARGLAGMIQKVGLLPASNHQQVPFAYKMFARDDETGFKQSKAFKKAFSVDVSIDFIGVWDTVDSVGLFPRRLPFTESNAIVRIFRPAVSLDERRAKFKVDLCGPPKKHEQTFGTEGQKLDVPRVSGIEKKSHAPKKHKLHKFERQFSSGEFSTDIEEVWFSGCHCDVGGGSVKNGTSHSLARIPLRWMIRECFKKETGILFTPEGIWSAGIDPANLYPKFQDRPPPLPVDGFYIQPIPSDKKRFRHYAGVNDSIPVTNTMSEEEHELRDAMSPIYDQLSLSRFWWVLELIPMKQRFKKSDNSLRRFLGINLGRGRHIPKQKKEIKIHRSVKLRIESRYPDGQPYVPRASFQKALNLGNVKWVD